MAGEMTLLVKMLLDGGKAKKDLEKAMKGIPMMGGGEEKGGGLGASLGLDKLIGTMTAKLVGIIGAVAIGVMFLAKLLGGIMKGFDPLLKMTEIIGSQIGMILRNFLMLFMPIFLAISSALKPVVKMFSLILRPVYLAMMTAMEEAGGGLEGLGAGMGAGLAGLGKVVLVLFGELFKAISGVIIDIVFYGIEAFAILIGGMLGMYNETVNFVAAMEIARVSLKTFITAGVNDVINYLTSFGEDVEDTGEDVDTGLTLVQDALVKLAGLFSLEFAANITEVYLAINLFEQEMAKLAENGLIPVIDAVADLANVAGATAVEQIEAYTEAIRNNNEEIARIADIKAGGLADDLLTSPLTGAGGLAGLTPQLEELTISSEKAKGETSNLLDSITGLGAMALGTVNPVTGLATFLGTDLVNSFISTAKEGGTAADAINKHFIKLKNKWEGLIDNAKSVLSNLKSQSNSKQTGGPINETGVYLLHKGERVITSGQASSGQGNQNVSINISGVSINKDMDIRDLASKLETYMQQERRRRTSYG